MNFPDSPSNGDTVTLNGKEYSYSSANSTWLPASEAVSASTILSDTAPVSPSAGDLWYNTDNGTMNVYYNDGSSSQWVGTSGPAGPAGAAGSNAPAGNSTTFVADTPALIALSSMSAGDQALVVDTNKLFIYTGSAWYLIATMVNASPTPISGVAPAYTLEKDGTATTITAVSTDPEGFPLTWSYAVTTGSLGSTATVSQADNVFTITPSTDSADEGEFSITFSATDGGNTGVVNAISAFTLVFAITDPNFNQVSFLSHFDGTDNGVNNVFTDSSTFNHPITANGNVTQGSFSPFARPDGEWAVSFDGTGDLIEGPSVDLLGSGAFTFECWVNVPSKTTHVSYTDAFLAQYQSNANFIFGTKYNVVRVWMGGAEVHIGNTAIVGNGWHHIAITRNASNSVRLFVDGVANGAAFTNSTDFSLNLENFEIGSWNYGANSALHGNISNLRVVKGTAVYDPSASTITVPSSSLTAITNTSLLTCQSNRFIDNSTNAYTLTPSNQTAVSAFSSFLTSAAYDPAVNGASAYFDGSGDRLRAPEDASTRVAASNFTFEAWVYPTTLTTVQNIIFGQGAPGVYSPFNIYIVGTKIHIFISTTGSSWDITSSSISSNSVNINTWNHVALVRNGTTIGLYINGVADNTYVVSAAQFFTPTSETSIGGRDGMEYFPGYITDARLVIGAAVYTSAFTPPTAPLTAIANTKLLLNMADGQAIDSAAQNNLTLYGNAKLSTTQAKFGTSSLSTIHGTQEYAYIPSGVNLTGDFTIEGQFYPTTLTPAAGLFDLRDANSSSRLDFWVTGSGYYGYDGVAGYIGSATSVTVLNQWSHVAICRVGSTVSVYHNGVLQWTTTHTNAYPAGNIKIGYGGSNGMTGYIDEVRVSNFARYTGNFTAPVLEFGAQGS